MPALPDAPQVLRIRYGFTIGEDTRASVRQYYQYTGAAPSVGDLNAFAAGVFTEVGTVIAPVMTADRVNTEVVVTDLTSATSAEGLSVGTNTGTRVGTELPAATCLLQSLEIARRYRGGHPRTYWPFGAEADLNDPQTWTDTFVGVATGALGDLDGFVGANPPAGVTGLVPVNVSYYKGFTVFLGTTGRARNVSTPRAAAVIDPVVGTLVRTGIAIIRRRELRLA